MIQRSVNLPQDVYDVIIVGGGPAGLTAGLYAARGGMKAVLIESPSVMGQAVMTDRIENYPGIESINGFELVSAFRKQTEEFGLEFRRDTVGEIRPAEKEGVLSYEAGGDGGSSAGLALVAASGARPRKLNIPGEEEFTGKGVSYCAVCDAAFFRDKKVIVIGGGDTAAEEALFLTRFCDKVTIVHRRDRLRASSVIRERVMKNGKIDLIWTSVVEEIKGGTMVESVVIKDVNTGEKKDIACEGVFVFAGWEPNTGFLEGLVDLDPSSGGIIVDKDMRASRQGIFAAGDCCKRPLHQIITACGDGAVAAWSAQKYVEEIKGIAYK